MRQSFVDWFRNVGWSYDPPMDRPATLSYPGGNAVTYSYDAQNRVSGMSVNAGGTAGTLVSGVQHASFGALTGLTYGNNLSRTLSYDKDARLTGITTGGVQSLGYGYDSANRLTGITNYLNSSLSEGLGYDALSRLNAVSSSGLGNQGISFDANGTRTSYAAGGVTDTLMPDPYSNRITSIAGGRARSYTYDTLGNTRSVSGYGGNYSYQYDAFNRLSTLTGGTSTSYTYNALGQRASKQHSGLGVEAFVNAPDGHLLYEPLTSQATVWLEGQPIALLRGSTVYYIHPDHLGRPNFITNTGGSVVWQENDTAFDRGAIPVSMGGVNLGFPGQFYDGESGLWYNGARYYDASNGRYLQSDPIGLVGGLNTYSYVGGNPVSLIDLSGLYTFQVGLTITFSFGPVALQFSAGVAVDGTGAIGTYYSEPRGGIGSGAELSGWVSAAYSGNACSIKDLSGPFTNASVGGGAGPSASVDGFTGPGAQGQLITGVGGTYGFGLGAGGSVTVTDTVITPIGHF